MMKLATTTGVFDDYCNLYTERIKNVCDAGFKYIDLSLYSINKNDPLFHACWDTGHANVEVHSMSKLRQ